MELLKRRQEHGNTELDIINFCHFLFKATHKITEFIAKHNKKLGSLFMDCFFLGLPLYLSPLCN